MYYSVEIEKETNNIIAGYEGSLVGVAYIHILNALDEYKKKGIIDSVDAFMGGNDNLDVYINYSWAASAQQISGIKRKIENILKKL